MTHKIALVNMKDGSVQGHKAGCADLKRNTKNHAEADGAWEFEVSSKFGAFLEYNADFIDDDEENPFHNCWPIEWLPCADHVPNATAEETVTPIFAEPTLVRGKKWTQVVAADGTVLAWILNDHMGLLSEAVAR